MPALQTIAGRGFASERSSVVLRGPFPALRFIGKSAFSDPAATNNCGDSGHTMHVALDCFEVSGGGGGGGGGGGPLPPRESTITARPDPATV